MAIRVGVISIVRPGKQNELFETLKTFKKAVERAGGTYAVRREVAGPQKHFIIPTLTTSIFEDVAI